MNLPGYLPPFWLVEERRRESEAKPKRRRGSVGAKVYSLHELDMLSRMGVCVVGGTFRRPCPAAWVMSMQARTVCRLLNSGLYVWKMPPKEEEE